MRVLQVVADGAPGGGTNHVMQILGGMPKNIECGLVTQQGSYLFEQARKLGVHVVGGDFFRSRFDRAAMNRIQEAISEYSPNVVHCHGGRAAFFSSFLKCPIPTIYTVHGFHYARKRFLQRIMGWAGEFWSIRRVGKVLFVCDYDKQLAESSSLLPTEKDNRVIYNGIKPLEPQESRGKLGIGFVGRFVYQKNPQLFLDVMERLPEMRGVMVGGGDLDSEIQAEVKKRGLTDRLDLLGSLSHAETLEVISKLDVLVMTPRWEGLPLLPLEAMFMKVPVVSTAVGGIPEVITHEKTGMLSANEDGVELSTLVRRVVEDKRFRDGMIQNAYEVAHQKFSQQNMLDEIQNCYEELSAIQ